MEQISNPRSNMPIHGMPSVGELINQSIAIIKQRPGFFFTIAAIPAAIFFVGQIIISINTFWIIWFLLIMILSAVLSVYAWIATIKGLADDKMNDWKQAYKDSTKLFWPAIWVGILVGIVVMIGFIFLIIPGMYLGVALSFYIYTLVLENARGWNAAEKSKELVKGYWWGVFGRMIAIGFLIGISVAIIGAVVGLADDIIVLALYNFIVTMIVTPIMTAYSYLIYKSLKSIKGSNITPQKPDQPVTATTV